MHQCFGNTVRRVGRITGGDTLITSFNWLSSVFFFFQKPISYRPSRHSHRTVHNHNIFFLCMQICLFIRLGGITFPGCHKPGSHLYAIGSQFHCMKHIFSGKNPACHNHRNLFFILIRILFHFRKNPSNLLIIGFRGKLLQLLSGKSQMSAGFRSLDHHKIRHPLVMMIPKAADHSRRLHSGYDRGDLRLTSRNQFWQFHGKSCTGNNQVNPGFHSGFHILRILLRCYHDIHTQDSTLGNLSGFLNLFSDHPQIGSDGIFFKLRIPIPDLCRGNHSYTATGCHTSR